MLKLLEQKAESIVDLRDLELFELDGGRIEGKPHRERELGVQEQSRLFLHFLLRALLQLCLHLPDEGGRHSLLELIRGRVEVEDLDDLGDLQLRRHVTDRLYVVLRFPGLQELRCLDDGREGLDDVDLLRVDLLVARPLLQLRGVVPEGQGAFECYSV